MEKTKITYEGVDYDAVIIHGYVFADEALSNILMIDDPEYSLEAMELDDTIAGYLTLGELLSDNVEQIAIDTCYDGNAPWDDCDEEECTWVVDVPIADRPGEFSTIQYFKTEKEAIKFAKKYGADDKGMISLISNIG